MKKIVFLHHQRCGGTTIRKVYSPFAIGYGSYKNNNIVDRISEKVKSIPSLRMIEVEPGYYIDELATTQYHFFTTIRNPIDRALSWLELHTRVNEKQSRFYKVTETDEERFSEEFWQKVHGKLIKNHVMQFNMCNYYTKIYARNGPVQLKVVLGEADWKKLISKFSTMSFLIFDKSTYATDILYLESVFSLNKKDNIVIPKAMAGNDEFVNSAPLWFIDFLKEKNKIDLRFWEYVLNIPTNNNFYLRHTYYN